MKNYEQTRSTLTSPIASKKRSVRTESFDDILRKNVSRNPRCSMLKNAKCLQQSKRMTGRIVKNGLLLKPYKMQHRYLISKASKRDGCSGLRNCCRRCGVPDKMSSFGQMRGFSLRYYRCTFRETRCRKAILLASIRQCRPCIDARNLQGSRFALQCDQIPQNLTSSSARKVSTSTHSFTWKCWKNVCCPRSLTHAKRFHIHLEWLTIPHVKSDTTEVQDLLEEALG